MDRIPFHLPEINMGLTEIKGSIFLEDEFLVIDVETAFMGEFDKDPQVIKIEPTALAAVSLRTGFIKDEIVLRPKKAQLLEVLPGEHVYEAKLKIWRTQRAAAERLVAVLNERRRAAAPREDAS